MFKQSTIMSAAKTGSILSFNTGTQLAWYAFLEVVSCVRRLSRWFVACYLCKITPGRKAHRFEHLTHAGTPRNLSHSSWCRTTLAVVSVHVQDKQRARARKHAGNDVLRTSAGHKRKLTLTVHATTFGLLQPGRKKTSWPGKKHT